MRTVKSKFLYDSPQTRISTGLEQVPGGRTSTARFHLWAVNLTLGGGARFSFPESGLPEDGVVHLRRGDVLLVQPDVVLHWETPPTAPAPLDPALRPVGTTYQWHRLDEVGEPNARTTRKAPRPGPEPDEVVWETVNALFEPRPHWLEWLHSLPMSGGVARLHFGDPAMFGKLRSGLLGVHRVYTRSLAERQEWGLAALERVLLRLRTQSLVKSALPDDRVRAALKFMHENYSGALSVADVARSAFTTESTLYLLFRTAVGVTPMQYLDTLRMERASEMLCHPHARVNAVSTAVGFTNPDRFTLHFRRHTGKTPREFRRGPAYGETVKGR